VFSGVAKEWQGFDSRNASEVNFQYAQGKPANALKAYHPHALILGDVPNNKVFASFHFSVLAPSLSYRAPGC